MVRRVDLAGIRLDICRSWPKTRLVNILCVCGSLQENSSNLTLLQWLAENYAKPTQSLTEAPAANLAGNPEPSADSGFLLWEGLGSLPLYNPDLDTEPPPAPVQRWRTALDRADRVLIASPEYAHSLTGVVKNAIDWIVGSGELVGKPVAITCAVRIPGRGEKGLRALAQTLRAVDAQIVWEKPVLFQNPLKSQRESLPDSVRQQLDNLMASLSQG